LFFVNFELCERVEKECLERCSTGANDFLIVKCEFKKLLDPDGR
jgi:hypothetical protein